jgi:hypothetical protein
MDINGCRYIITFRDHASTYTYCALMATRHEVPDKIMAWGASFEEHRWTDPLVHPLRQCDRICGRSQGAPGRSRNSSCTNLTLSPRSERRS